MASVTDHNDKELLLRDCACGSEPEYRTANGIAHVITCPKCAATTGLERCGIDAVTAWNDLREVLSGAALGLTASAVASLVMMSPFLLALWALHG